MPPMMMTVPVEVEATPELVEKHLRDYAEKLGVAGKFPIPSGEMALLVPAVEQAVGALEGAKVLIVEASQKTPNALIAFIKKTGGYGVFWGMAAQVQVPPAGDDPNAASG
jgi:hypothetical protein